MIQVLVYLKEGEQVWWMLKRRGTGVDKYLKGRKQVLKKILK